MRFRIRRASWSLAVPLFFSIPFTSYAQAEEATIPHYILHPIRTDTLSEGPSAPEAEHSISPEPYDHQLPHLFYAKCWNDSVNAISDEYSVVAFTFDGKPYHASTSQPLWNGWLEAFHLDLQGRRRPCLRDFK